MKILHCADCHLGRRTTRANGDYSKKRFEDYFNAFNWAVDCAIQNEVEVFLIAGDFFDRKELLPDILERAETALLRLKNNNIRTILIEGNHDNITNGNESESWLIYLQNKNLLTRPNYEINEESGYSFNKLTYKDINFYGLGYPGAFVNETLNALANELESIEDAKNIILVHTAIASTNEFPGTVNKETIERFKDKTLYIAGGHFHYFHTFPNNAPYFFIPGSLELWEIDEITQKKGVIIFDTDTRKYQFYESVKRHSINIIITIHSSNYDDFKNEFLELIQPFLNEIIKDESVIKLSINLINQFPFDTEWCEQYLNEKGALKSFIKINIEGTNTNLDFRNSALEVDNVEHDIIDTWKYFSANTDITINSLHKLKIYQKEKNQDMFIEEFDCLLDNILNKKGKSDEN